MASFRTVSICSVLFFGLLLPRSEAFSLGVPSRAIPIQKKAAQRSASLFGSDDEGTTSSKTSLRSTTVAAGHAQNQTSAAASVEDDQEDDSTMNNQDDTDTQTIRKGYQRAEDWDAEQKSGKMTWEQKVQYDGLKMGNSVRQNDILMRHLHTF